MKTYLLVKGKPRKMVGDPNRDGRWAGQRKRQLREGDPAPAKRRDGFEPCWTTHACTAEARRHLGKALRNEDIAELLKVQAESHADALSKKPSAHKTKKGDS